SPAAARRTGLVSRYAIDDDRDVGLALDRGARDLTIALDGMCVPERDQAALDIRAHDDRRADAVQRQVGVAAEIGALHEGAAPLDCRRHSDRPEERRDRDLDRSVAGREVNLAIADRADDRRRLEAVLERVAAHESAQAL